MERVRHEELFHLERQRRGERHAQEEAVEIARNSRIASVAAGTTPIGEGVGKQLHRAPVEVANIRMRTELLRSADLSCNYLICLARKLLRENATLPTRSNGSWSSSIR